MPSDRVRVGLSTGFARDAYLTHCDFSELESVAEVGYLSLAEFEEGTLTAEREALEMERYDKLSEEIEGIEEIDQAGNSGSVELAVGASTDSAGGSVNILAGASGVETGGKIVVESGKGGKAADKGMEAEMQRARWIDRRGRGGRLTA